MDGLLIDENAASLAVCIMKAIQHPESMKRIGESASERLYLSWDDAVARAMERYEIVMDNYRSGKTAKKRISPMESFMTLSSRIMGL